MANPDHVAIVKQGAEAIRLWRKQHPEERLNLYRADLYEIPLYRPTCVKPTCVRLTAQFLAVCSSVNIHLVS